MIAKQLSRFANVAIALGALLVTSAILHALLPPAIPPGVVEKLEFFAAHKDEFDTLFLGTSRIYYAVSPELFDTVTSEHGLATRTFNFGIDSMHPPESFYVLDQILKTGPRNLKWVFLELDNIQTKPYAEALGTQRLLYWHDWRRTALTLKKAVNPQGRSQWYYNVFQIWIARRQLILHLALFAKQFANVGRAADFFSAPDASASVSAKLRLGPRGDGYCLVGAPMDGERAANFRNLMALEVANAHLRFLDAHAEVEYREYAEEIRQIGAAPIFLVPPSPSQSPLLFRKAPPAPLLLFNDCKAYPQFYGEGSRADEGHLSNEGAAEFTRLLALKLVEYVRRP